MFEQPTHDQSGASENPLDQIKIECTDRKLGRFAVKEINQQMIEDLIENYPGEWKKIILKSAKRADIVIRGQTLEISVNQIGDIKNLFNSKATPQKSQHEHYVVLAKVLEPVVRRFLDLGTQAGVPSNLARSVLEVLVKLEALEKEKLAEAVSILDKMDRNEGRTPNVKAHYEAAKSVLSAGSLSDRQGRQLVRLAEAFSRVLKAPPEFGPLVDSKVVVKQRIALLEPGISFTDLVRDASSMIGELKDLAAIIQCLPEKKAVKEMQNFFEDYLKIRKLMMQICEKAVIGAVSVADTVLVDSVIKFIAENIQRTDSVGLTDLLRRSVCPDDGWESKHTFLKRMVKEFFRSPPALRSEEEALDRMASVLPELVGSLGDFDCETIIMPDSIGNSRQELLSLIRSTGGIEGEIFHGVFAELIQQCSPEIIYQELALFNQNRRKALETVGKDGLTLLNQGQRGIFRQAVAGIADVLLSDCNREHMSRWADLTLEERNGVVSKMQAIVGQLLRPEMGLESRSEALQGSIAVPNFLLAVDQTIEAIDKDDNFENMHSIVDLGLKAQTLAEYPVVSESKLCQQRNRILADRLRQFMDSLSEQYTKLMEDVEIFKVPAVLARMQVINQKFGVTMNSPVTILAGLEEFREVYESYWESDKFQELTEPGEVLGKNLSVIPEVHLQFQQVVDGLSAVQIFLNSMEQWNTNWQEVLNFFQNKLDRLQETLSAIESRGNDGDQ